MDKTLFLLDGHALLYRAYFTFAGHPMVNTKGLDTGCIYGFLNTLLRLSKKEKLTHIAVVFDSRTTFRKALYSDYKANRARQPEAITAGFDWIGKALEALQIPTYAKEGYEADDIIGTLAIQASQRNYAVYIVSPDKDFGQVIRKNIWLYRPGRAGKADEIIGLEQLYEKFGVRRPEQLIDKLALQGDSIDNIPGIPGIGEKTATSLLETYDTVEHLLKKSNTLSKKVRKSIEEHQEALLLYKRLVTIDTQVPIKWVEADTKLKACNKEALQRIFVDLEFNNLLKRFVSANMALDF